jgi:hypothetical protein
MSFLSVLCIVFRKCSMALSFSFLFVLISCLFSLFLWRSHPRLISMYPWISCCHTPVTKNTMHNWLSSKTAHVLGKREVVWVTACQIGGWGVGVSIYWSPRSPNLAQMDLYFWRCVGNQAIIIINKYAWNYIYVYIVRLVTWAGSC